MLTWKWSSRCGRVLSRTIRLGLFRELPLIARVCPVYSASKAVLPDGSGQRLANFLWRVWGSPSILYNLTGNQLAAHFSAISEDGPLRTTPTQSPRASRNLSIAVRAPKSRTRFLSPPSGSTETGPSVQRLTTPLHKDEKDDDPPQSTLKSTRHTTSAATARRSHISTPSLITEEDDDESTPSTTPVGSTLQKSSNNRTARSSIESTDNETLSPGTTDPSTLQSVSSQDTIRPSSETVSKPKRTKRLRSASTKKRPVAMKRKSSQSSSSNASSTISPHLPAEPSGLSDLSDPSIDEAAAAAAAEPADYQQARTEPADSPTKTKQSSLVDPNFRSKFVEKTRSAQSSFVNLPSLFRKPSASAATPASYQAAGMLESSRSAQPAGRGRGKVTFTEGSKPPGPAGPDVGVGDHDPDSSVLPRTKSQLTMLLEKDRRAGGRGS